MEIVFKATVEGHESNKSKIVEDIIRVLTGLATVAFSDKTKTYRVTEVTEIP